MASKKSGLGKGLDALFSDNSVEEREYENIRLSQISPNINQPRKDFDENSLNELCNSIKENGVLQPIVVRYIQDNNIYEIIAGERRYKASVMAGLTTIPAVIKDFDDIKARQIALIENIQRENLNAVEIAIAYKELCELMDLTHEELAEKLDKPRSAISNYIRILSLPREVLEMLKMGSLSLGHAKVLLSLDDTTLIIKLADETVKSSLSVRQLEVLISKIAPKKSNTKSKKGDIFYEEIEISLSQYLSRKVKIKANVKEKGTITIEFLNKEELEELTNKLSELK